MLWVHGSPVACNVFVCACDCMMLFSEVCRHRLCVGQCVLTFLSQGGCWMMAAWGVGVGGSLVGVFVRYLFSVCFQWLVVTGFVTRSAWC